ncbi:MAG: 4a-hydroxytetrahydrobiopterin dehydratase [Verrucomicrobiae bacterium]|nr:4a-hydroxytetrahydrobiopterin dehydratase [Verrucomicrobiae bacterium]
MNALLPHEIEQSLAALKHWQIQPALIRRQYAFRDFPTAMTFVNRVAELAEKAWHHPDIDIRWNKVVLSFTTHEAGGLTRKDFDLAAACDSLAQTLPGPANAGT